MLGWQGRGCWAGGARALGWQRRQQGARLTRVAALARAPTTLSPRQDCCICFFCFSPTQFSKDVLAPRRRTWAPPAAATATARWRTRRTRRRRARPSAAGRTRLPAAEQQQQQHTQRPPWAAGGAAGRWQRSMGTRPPPRTGLRARTRPTSAPARPAGGTRAGARAGEEPRRGRRSRGRARRTSGGSRGAAACLGRCWRCLRRASTMSRRRSTANEAGPSGGPGGPLELSAHVSDCRTTTSADFVQPNANNPSVLELA